MCAKVVIIYDCQTAFDLQNISVDFYQNRDRETMQCRGGRSAHPLSRAIRFWRAGLNDPAGWGREEAY